eukprot:Nitzschia sp. Nitz4//scaffold283_size24287//16133//16803//NITZ4_008407-RA/size24287-augustus-gene-0.30-mRNA-1//1//CDS//3329545660//5858//frame0
MATASVQTVPVEKLDEPRIKTVPFWVNVPQVSLQSLDDPNRPAANQGTPLDDKVVVGSVVLLNNSFMVWVGWGNTHTKRTENLPPKRLDGFGQGAPFMGQLVVAMPRTKYQGAFGTGANEPSCSQIIGSASTDDQMLSTQMASRLSLRSKMAVYVSCELASGGGDGSLGGGMDPETVSFTAAALAEKEIWKIIQEHQPKQS